MKRFLLVLACLAMLLHSCVSEHEFGNEKQDVSVSTRAVVGENASDPYRLESMQMALEELAATYPELHGVQLQPTDYYVCFSPVDSIQVDTLLMRDIEVFYHPLDVMSSELGEKDVVLDEDDRAPLKIYTVVPVDFAFPEGVDYEIIYGVFIQNGNVAAKSTLNTNSLLSQDLYKKILSRSMQLTGNASATRATSDADWEAEATIFYEYLPDDFRPLPGVKVRAQYYTNISSRYGEKYTNSEGSTGALLSDLDPNGYVNYDIVWDHDRYAIRYVNTTDVYVTDLAVNVKGPISINIDRYFAGGQALTLAGVHRALYAYFEEDHPLTYGIAKPDKIYVSFINQYNPRKRGEYNFARRNKIKIWAKDGADQYRQAKETTSIIAHELGHASHYTKTNFMHIPTCRHCESWANGVKYAYMESIYPGYTITPAGTAYTRLVECLMHQGLTLAEIHESFVAGENWWGWRDELKSRTPLEDRIIDVIFEFPNNYTFNLQDFIVSDNKSYNKGELVYFKRKAEVPNNYEIVDWEIVGGDGIIMDETWSQMAAVFDGTGYKTIRASIQVDNDYIFACEKQVFIDDTDIFVNQMPNYTYDDVYCKISTMGDNIRQVSWNASDDNQYQTGRGVHFYYTTSGVKTLNFTVTYNPLSDSGKSIDVEYEREITVEDLPDLYSFELMDEPPYKAETTYKLKYKRTDEQIEILTSELNHYLYRIYTPFSYWNFDAATGIAEFKIPGDVSIPINYNVRITYLRPGHTEPSQAVIPVADYERAPYPPERDWFNR